MDSNRGISIAMKHMHRMVWVMAFMLVFSMHSFGGRLELSINNNWLFLKGDYSLETIMQEPLEWKQVNLPHTWNVDDVMDETHGYYRGTGWYKKTLFLEPGADDNQFYLKFEGANQVTDVFVNGKKAGSHTGGYTGFIVPLSPYLSNNGMTGKQAQEIVVSVNNSHDENIPPLSADFTFYGGVYRDVLLMELPPIHFDHGKTASSGVFITTPVVSRDTASVLVRGRVLNHLQEAAEVIIQSDILDESGKLVQQQFSALRLPPGSGDQFSQSFRSIAEPRLWSTDRPYLYSIHVRIIDPGSGKVLDQTIQPLGFRYFRFDPSSGFHLNGKHLKLIGVNRHQDFAGFGNAIPDAVNEMDVRIMKDMGINFLRIAHYPQDQRILQLCDQLGILASVEIPIVNRITESREFFDNSLQMQLEMIHQNYNHPSLIVWAYMNEVLLRPRYLDDPARYEKYAKSVNRLAQAIEDLTRQEDPYRYTMIPNHGAFQRYVDAGLTEIPMLVGWNLYQGWYDGNIAGFESFLDKHHALLPDKPLLVTEYGGGADRRIRSAVPERFDFSVEYNNYLHRIYLEAMLERPFVAAGLVWNFADFNSEGRVDAVPHMNNKGLSDWNRIPKDTYYLYKALLSKEPYIAIASRLWTQREDVESNPGCGCAKQQVEIYSNTDDVRLIVNGQAAEKTAAFPFVSVFNVTFSDGMNTIVATGTSDEKTVRDQADINFRVQSRILNRENSLTSISISAGDKRTIVDQETGLIWIPDQPYTHGSWGYVGGEIFAMKNSNRQPYGSDIQIDGTPFDPVYQTQREGIEEYRFDVGNGYYELTLHFADLEPAEQGTPLPYNLDETVTDYDTSYRAFSIMVNDAMVLKGINNREQLRPGRAFVTKTTVIAGNNEGIRVQFLPLYGKTILNGIQLKKIY